MIRTILKAGKIDYNNNTVIYPPSQDPTNQWIKMKEDKTSMVWTNGAG